MRKRPLYRLAGDTMQLVAFYVVLTSIIAVVVAIKISIMTGLCAFGAAMLSATAGGGTKEGLRKWQGIGTVTLDKQTAISTPQ